MSEKLLELESQLITLWEKLKAPLRIKEKKSVRKQLTSLLRKRHKIKSSISKDIRVLNKNVSSISEIIHELEVQFMKEKDPVIKERINTEIGWVEAYKDKLSGYYK